MKHLNLFFACLLMVVLSIGQVWGADDVIDNAATSSDLGSTATNTWKTFSLTGASGAQYSIKSMGTKSTTNALTWNTSGYLYQTTSGGKVKSITVNGKSGKSVKIFGQNDAYSAQASGTPLITLSLTGSDVTYTFTDDYNYIAINGGTSGVTITSITIEYQGGGDQPNLLQRPQTQFSFRFVYLFSLCQCSFLTF